MKTLSAILCTGILIAMTTKQTTAVAPGLDGFLVDMDIIADLFAMAGLPANTIIDWQTKMAVEIRGIIGAKLYAMARLDNIDADLKGFKEWLENVLPGQKILALYGFGGNTLADLCASIYMHVVFDVSIDILITEPEYVASGTVYPAGDIVFQIFKMLESNPFNGPVKNSPFPKKIQFLNSEALAKYKTLQEPSQKSEFVEAKKNYLAAVQALPKLSDDPTAADIINHIAMDETNAGLKNSIDKFLEKCTTEIQNAQARSKWENEVINNIGSYALVTEAVVGASPSNGDFKLTFLPTIRIAMEAQKVTKNGFNILATNDNPAMGLSVQGVGMSWMYRKLGLKPLQPSFNIHMGPVKKGVLYSSDFANILHISIMPVALENAFRNHKVVKSLLLEGGVTWKYDSNGNVTPTTHLKNGLTKLDNLSYPVKVINVSEPDTTTNKITSKFTMSQFYKDALDRDTFLRELKGLFLDTFDIVAAINGGASF